MFRELNEWTSDRYGESSEEPSDEGDRYLCECGDASCSEPILLTEREYEAVRAEPARFALAKDHENPESSWVVGECSRFATVDNVVGVAKRIARETDPRA